MGCHEPFDISGSRMMEIYKMIERYKGVLALDVGDITMPSHQPMSLARISEACPGLKITVCHLLAPMREKKKGVGAEPSALKPRECTFRYLLDAEDYGSDVILIRKHEYLAKSKRDPGSQGS